MTPDAARAYLDERVLAKLHVEGLTIASPWVEIEACLAQVVSPTACIRAARGLCATPAAQSWQPEFMFE